MLTQEQEAIITTLSTRNFYPAFFKALKATLGKKKRPAVPTRTRGTTASQRTSQTGKRKATELSSDSSEPATRRPATGAGLSPQQPRTKNAAGEQASSGGRQIVSHKGGKTYAAVAAAPIAPQLPSGPLMSLAKCSDPSELAVSSESAPRRMSDDMSGPLSGMPVGATTTNSMPAGQRTNKTPIFITAVTDTRGFLTRLRASCPCPLTAQIKAEKFMVIPSTADGFRATVCALRSLDGKEGVSFHIFSLPGDRCVRLLVKNLGKRMTESVVREELQALDIRARESRSSAPAAAIRILPRIVPPLPILSYLWRGGLRCPGCGLSPNSAVCGSRWKRTWRRKAPCNASAASASVIRSATVDTCPGASRVGDLISLVSVQSLGGSPSAAVMGASTRRTTGAA
jgi:hypothetical protein